MTVAGSLERREEEMSAATEISVRLLNDTLAKAAGIPPRTKCISFRPFRSSLGFFVLVPIGIIRPFYNIAIC